MENIKIYLAGPLFGIANRHHNLLLARELEKIGYCVVVPQERALKYYDGNRFDLLEIAKDCRSQLMESDVVVANIDGAEADSGTAVEVGIALSQALLPEKTRPTVICVRTDFRTEPDKEIGINGMFGLADKVIYRPANVKSLQEVIRFYAELAKEIDSSVTELRPKTFRK